MNRTDLAHDIAAQHGLILEKSTIHGIEVTRTVIDEKASAKCGKPAGSYVTMQCNECDVTSETAILSHILQKMLKTSEQTYKTLVAGLGNANITPDALGVLTASKVLATAHFTNQEQNDELRLNPVYAVKTGVMAQTGIESAEQLKLISDGIKPDRVIVIDSLACNEYSRLAKTIQVTDTGISPGSGVQNKRKEISARVFGVPIIAIGVPFVIDQRCGADENAETLMLVPRDIDMLVAHYAKVISGAVNGVLNPDLTGEEIEELLR